MEQPERRSGRVLALQANFALVALDQPGPLGQERLLCTRRTRLGKSGLGVHVGDGVDVEAIDGPGGRGAVVAVAPRANLLPRPAVANVSRVVVVAALAEPQLDPLQLTRFLVTAESTGQPVLLVLSKADLLPAAAVEAWCLRLAGWGYPVQPISTRTGQGLEAVRDSLSHPGIAVLCGPSGVGKSSLLNALLPELGLRVESVSGRLRRGRHTTRHVELFQLAGAALVADTPGFNRPELPADPAALAMAFPELRQQLAHGDCRFSNCLHQADPGCTIGTAWDRYPLYSTCLAEVLAAGAMASERPRLPEVGLRVRSGQLEPRLAPQLRRHSRRRRRQELDDELSSPPAPAD